jgi:glutamyl-tRNA reductase
VNDLGGVFLYDIDDLNGVVSSNLEERMSEAHRAEGIIDEMVVRFRQWYGQLDIVPTIVALREKLYGIAEAEVRKTLNQSLGHLSAEDGQAVRRMTNALVNKILHDPTLFLKRNGCLGEKSVYLDAARKLFKLDEDEI